jgi:hypothetical protein
MEDVTITKQISRKIRVFDVVKLLLLFNGL